MSEKPSMCSGVCWPLVRPEAMPGGARAPLGVCSSELRDEVPVALLELLWLLWLPLPLGGERMWGRSK